MMTKQKQRCFHRTKKYSTHLKSPYPNSFEFEQRAELCEISHQCIEQQIAGYSASL